MKQPPIIIRGRHVKFLPLALALPLVAAAATGTLSDPVPGWASQGSGTTGGKGGKEVTVKTIADLRKYAKEPGPFIIWVDGTMGSYGTRGEGDGDRVVVASDKSILGLPGARLKGGFDLSGVKNVVIRNLVVEGPGACDNDCGSAGEGRKDNISIVDGTTNVWLDHLDVLDGEDGNADITKKSDFVTISWTKFRYTDKSYPSGTSGKSHRFSNLLGGSDNADKEGADNLNVTFYRTWWGEGVAERQPRVRFGKVHVANCLFDSKDPGQTHNIRAGYKADILVEGSYFDGQKKPIDLYENDFTAVTVKSDNVFKGCSGNTAGSGTAFTPPYGLKLVSADAAKAAIVDAADGAGATLVWASSSVAAPEGATDAPVRLAMQDGIWQLANPGDETVSVLLATADGRRERRFELPAGATRALPASGGARFVRVESPTASYSIPVPGR